MPPFSQRLLSRFQSYISPIPDAKGCQLWNGPRWSHGYGTFNIGQKKFLAHRVSWVIHNGEIPNKLFVLHRCDVKVCVNPKHLFLGTHTDNAKDRALKGRNGDISGDKHYYRRHPELIRRGKDHWTHKKPECLARGKRHPWHREHPNFLKRQFFRGSQNGQSKLNEQQVAQIFRLVWTGIPPKQIAGWYSITPSQVHHIKTGKAWAHLHLKMKLIPPPLARLQDDH